MADLAAGGSHRGVTPIPSSIVQAICQIMVTVEAVKKSQRNQHGGYNFASTDDIYAAVTRKMGEVGLVLLSLEDRCEIKRIEKDGKTAQWAHMEFSFILATTRDTWTDARAKRTLYIQVTGPQTFQAAQSYVEKAYLRSLLKLPTGDMDLDSMPQADNEDDQIALVGGKKRKSSAEASETAASRRSTSFGPPSQSRSIPRCFVTSARRMRRNGRQCPSDGPRHSMRITRSRCHRSALCKRRNRPCPAISTSAFVPRKIEGLSSRKAARLLPLSRHEVRSHNGSKIGSPALKAS